MAARCLAGTLAGTENAIGVARKGGRHYTSPGLALAYAALGHPTVVAFDQAVSRLTERTLAMRCSVRKVGALAGLLAGGGYLLAGPGTGCSSYIGNSFLVATDMCFVFDCQSGILGGVFDPCSGIGSGNQTVEGQTQRPFFTDCPTKGP